MGQTTLKNYSIAMWFHYSLCIVLYITVIICIYSSNGQITYLMVSENSLEIINSQSLDIQIHCPEILGKHLIWWKD